MSRLRPYLDNIVSPFQGDFIPSRHASDNIILTQELYHYLKQKMGKGRLMMLKIDLEKACDKIEWDFIDFMLELYRFPNHLKNLIMSYITTSFISILLNQGKLNSFTPSKGLR